MAGKREDTVSMLPIPGPSAEEGIVKDDETTTKEIPILAVTDATRATVIGIMILPECIGKEEGTVEERKEGAKDGRRALQSPLDMIPSWRTRIGKAQQPSGSRGRFPAKRMTDSQS